MKLPLRPNTRIHAPEGHFRNLRPRTIGRMPGDRTLHSLNTCNSIPTRVLCFEVSELHHRILIRPVSSTGQTSPMLLHLRLWSWLCGSTKEPSGFSMNHLK
jgi:hypothetical protein